MMTTESEALTKCKTSELNFFKGITNRCMKLSQSHYTKITQQDKGGLDTYPSHLS